MQHGLIDDADPPALPWGIGSDPYRDEATQRQGGISMAMRATGSYSEVHWLRMYYEPHGAGALLVPLPGGLMTIGMMGQVVPDLTRVRQVIAVEPQGHGHTADSERPLTYARTRSSAPAVPADWSQQPTREWSVTKRTACTLLSDEREQQRVDRRC
jgi:hypothetical protein